MSESIQQTCTVHKSGVFVVLVCHHLCPLQWRNCLSGDLSTMQIGVSLKGAVTEENYNNSLICMARINFRPSSAIVGVISNLTFVKVKPRYTKEGGEDLID